MGSGGSPADTRTTQASESKRQVVVGREQPERQPPEPGSPKPEISPRCSSSGKASWHGVQCLNTDLHSALHGTSSLLPEPCSAGPYRDFAWRGKRFPQLSFLECGRVGSAKAREGSLASEDFSQTMAPTLLQKRAGGLTSGDRSCSLLLKHGQSHTWVSAGTREYKIRVSSHMGSPCWESYLGHLHLMHTQHRLSAIAVAVPI